MRPLPPHAARPSAQAASAGPMTPEPLSQDASELPTSGQTRASRRVSYPSSLPRRPIYEADSPFVADERPDGYVFAPNYVGLDPETLDGLPNSGAYDGHFYYHVPLREWPQVPSLFGSADRAAPSAPGSGSASATSSSPLGPNSRRASAALTEAPPFVPQALWPERAAQAPRQRHAILPWSALKLMQLTPNEKLQAECRISRLGFDEMKQPVGIRVAGSQAVHIFEWSYLNDWLAFQGNFSWQDRTFINPVNQITTAMADLRRIESVFGL